MLPDSVLATFPPRWPAALAELAGPRVATPLDSAELRAIAAQDRSVRALLGQRDRPALPERLVERLPGLFQSGFNPAFARLCPCSFKQGLWPCPPLVSPAQLVRRLQHPGERAADMAYRCLQADCQVSLTLKPWYDFAPEQEFRLFFRDRRLAGASQYHPGAQSRLQHAELAELAARIADFARHIADALHIADAVADIVVFAPVEHEPLLLELNPWHPFTGTGLFDPTRPDPFERTLLVRTSARRTVELALPLG
jgi:hypothetical protein